MTVKRTANEIIIKLSIDVQIDEIQRFLDYLKYKEIVQKSRATQEQVNNLVKKVNKSW